MNREKRSSSSSGSPHPGIKENNRRLLLLSGRQLVFVVLIICILSAVGQRDACGRRPQSSAPNVALQRGLNALKENRFEDALEALTLAENEDPGDPRVRNFRGITLAQLGKTTDAEAEYRQAIRLDAKFEDAWRNLGFLLWMGHRSADARATLLRAIELSPGDAFAHYYLGRVELETQQYADAFHELELSRMPWPEEPNFLIQAARGYVALGKKDQASRILRQASTGPLGVAERAAVASLLFALSEYDETIELLKSEIKSRPADSAGWAQFDLALSYLLAGHYQQAAEQIRSYIEQRPATPTASEAAAGWSLLGLAEARGGDADKAAVALRQAANLEPGNEEHWLNLTRELMEASRYGEAVSASKEGIAANPNSYALQLRLGAAELAGGHYQEAEAAFRELVDAHDPLPTSYVGLAQVLLREGRAEEAAAVVTAAEQQIGKDFLLSYFRGLSLDRAGKRNEAMVAFREAISMNPGSSEARLGLGKSELAAGQANEAIAELQEALRLHPGDAQARRLLSQAYRRTGDTKRAEEFADTSSERPAAAEGDLLDDFLLPKWRMPAQQKNM
jgi:tetratricopeptide (TPR) repeat protein